MKFKNIPFYKKVLLSLATRSVASDGNCDIDTDGEKKFIEDLVLRYKKAGEKIVFFDVGVNVGHYSLVFMEECKKAGVAFSLHAFEPIKKSYDAAKSAIGESADKKINAVALSNSTGQATMYLDEDGSSLSSLYQRKLLTPLSKKEEITTMRGDEYVKKNGIGKISFLKIDVEGHELRALEGFGDFLDASKIDFIQFEYGGANLDSGTTLRQIYSLLSKKEFRVGLLRADCVELRNYSPALENFEYANYIAVSKGLSL